MKQLFISSLIMFIVSSFALATTPVAAEENDQISESIAIVETGGINLDELAYGIIHDALTKEEMDLLDKLDNAQISELSSLLKKIVNTEYPEGSPKINGCQWDHVSYWNESLTKSKNYHWSSHYAVYFTVGADANCYAKRSWLCSWSPTEGDISRWLLLLSRDRYWNGSGWVKDVALIIPTSCWLLYWYLPNSTKASSYYIYWNNWNNGCCE